MFVIAGSGELVNNCCVHFFPFVKTGKVFDQRLFVNFRLNFLQMSLLICIFAGFSFIPGNFFVFRLQQIL
jgi:hypothetical protein